MKKILKTEVMQSVPVVYEADRAGGYVVYAPTLPGCHSQGETLEQAEKNITEAIELYVEVMAAERKPLTHSRVLQGSVQVKIKAHAKA